MTKLPRASTPRNVELAVLNQSRRRCALCYYYQGDLSEKLGQIAHLDNNPANCAEDNLAFLCMKHHSVYDSTTRQHKNYTIQEAKEGRSQLYAAIARGDYIADTKPQRAGHRQADQQLLTEIISLMQRNGSIETLRKHNFGDPFDVCVLDMVGEFVYRNSPDREFLDQELEHQRKKLLEACRTFSFAASTCTWSLDGSSLRSVPREWCVNNPTHWNQVVNDLNNKATTVSDAYDDLVRSARKRLEL